MSNSLNYFKGNVYKIISSSTDKIYIGSTIKTIEKRLSEHENGYRAWIDSDFEHSYCTSYEILKYGDYNIILIKQINIRDRDELFKLEGFYQIENYYHCVNTQFSSPRPRNILIDKENKRYTCYCGREMYNKYKTRFHHIRTITHKINVIDNHKDVINLIEIDKLLEDILDDIKG
jgi:hypothetical protein